MESLLGDKLLYIPALWPRRLAAVRRHRHATDRKYPRQLHIRSAGLFSIVNRFSLAAARYIPFKHATAPGTAPVTEHPVTTRPQASRAQQSITGSRMAKRNVGLGLVISAASSCRAARASADGPRRTNRHPEQNRWLSSEPARQCETHSVSVQSGLSARLRDA